MNVNAELVGSVWKILVNVGDQVARGQEIMILESMKMEIPVEAPVSGKITQISVSETESVDAGMLLAQISID